MLHAELMLNAYDDLGTKNVVAPKFCPLYVIVTLIVTVRPIVALPILRLQLAIPLVPVVPSQEGEVVA